MFYRASAWRSEISLPIKGEPGRIADHCHCQRVRQQRAKHTGSELSAGRADAGSGTSLAPSHVQRSTTFPPSTFNLQRPSHLQPSTTFPPSTFNLQRPSHLQPSTTFPPSTFNDLPTFNLQLSTTFPPSTFNLQRPSHLQPSTFNDLPTFNLQPSTFSPLASCPSPRATSSTAARLPVASPLRRACARRSSARSARVAQAASPAIPARTQ